MTTYSIWCIIITVTQKYFTATHINRKELQRMRIVNKFKFIRSTTILVFLLLALFNISVAKSNKEEAEIVDYTISRGETLWSIAEENKAEKEDIRQYIYDIKKLNNMTDSAVYENQTIKIKKGQ